MTSIHDSRSDISPTSNAPPAEPPPSHQPTSPQREPQHVTADPGVPSTQDDSPSRFRVSAAPSSLPLHLDSTKTPNVAVPPPLPYSLRKRKLSIFLFWTLFFIDTSVQPLVLYYTLWYLTDLSDNLVFTLDFFQINFTIVWFILAVELIVGTVRKHPPIRLLAMPLPTVMYYFGFVYITLDVLRAFGYKAPFRISSTPKGSVMPTALYPLIEDIVAVDGGGGQKYRLALRSRYLASPMFRQMLFEMNCFWAGGAVAAATLTTILVFTLQRDAAYAVGWGLPFVWAALWTCITIPWVQWHLRREKAAWSHLTISNRDVLGSRPYQDTGNTRMRNPSFEQLAQTLPKKPFRRSLFEVHPWSRESRKKNLNEKELDIERGLPTDDYVEDHDKLRAHGGLDNRSRAAQQSTPSPT
ncbi:hypothetical protein KEM56_007826 [Ascosphaera pollenicola]|nr:hypothetical protein KEM56_007826 [Ascosphaera pollenicola]